MPVSVVFAARDVAPVPRPAPVRGAVGGVSKPVIAGAAQTEHQRKPKHSQRQVF